MQLSLVDLHNAKLDFFDQGLGPAGNARLAEDNFPRSFGIRIRSINTEPITREEYAAYYHSWGGSFISHPEVLQFFEDKYGVRTNYRG